MVLTYMACFLPISLALTYKLHLTEKEDSVFAAKEQAENQNRVLDAWTL